MSDELYTDRHFYPLEHRILQDLAIDLGEIAIAENIILGEN